MESAPCNILNLAERLEVRLLTAERAHRLPSLHTEVQDAPLSEVLHHTFKSLIAMADATRNGRGSPAFTGVALWRIAELVRDGAYSAERLERKLCKAKRKLKRRA